MIWTDRKQKCWSQNWGEQFWGPQINSNNYQKTGTCFLKQRLDICCMKRRSPGSRHESCICDVYIDDVCTLSFMSRSFTMKLATRDLSGAANCSGASWARWPRVVKGVMSCSRLAGSRPLCRGWRNTKHLQDVRHADLLVDKNMDITLQYIWQTVQLWEEQDSDASVFHYFISMMNLM